MSKIDKKNGGDDAISKDFCSVHTDLFSEVHTVISKQEVMHDDIKGLRNDIHDAVALAQEGIIQNAKDIALLQAKVEQLYEERPILFNIVSYKNRFIGAIGLIVFVLGIFGLKIFD